MCTYLFRLKPFVLTLWGELASGFGSTLRVNSRSMPVVKFTRFIVTTYYGVSLGSTSTSAAIINPPLSDSVKLTAWKRKNVVALREIASNREYMATSSSSTVGTHMPTMNVSALIDSAEYGKMQVSGKIKIADFEQRCFYLACDKCPSSTTAELGWEFECSRCQELRVSIPRAKILITLYDGDAEIDALAFGEIAEKILRKTAAYCVDAHTEGSDAFLHKANEYLHHVNFVLSITKKSIVRRRVKEDQYIIINVVDEYDSTNVDDSLPQISVADKDTSKGSDSLVDTTANAPDVALEPTKDDFQCDSSKVDHQIEGVNCHSTSIECDAGTSCPVQTNKGRRKLRVTDDSDGDDNEPLINSYKRRKD